MGGKYDDYDFEELPADAKKAAETLGRFVCSSSGCTKCLALLWQSHCSLGWLLALLDMDY